MKWLTPLVLPFILLVASGPIDSHDTVAGLDTRAVWVTRWGFKNSDDVKQLFDDLAALGINTVFFQVRGACDVLYRSSYEPWSPVLAGTLGVDPGWDPLEVALLEAHGRGIKLHAWINVFTAWQVSDSGDLPPRTAPLHVCHAHSEWLARDMSGAVMPRSPQKAKHNYIFLSPTHEGVQEYLEKVVEDLAGRYEIDGLHLDYVRFPDSSYSYDSDSRASYRLHLRLNDLSEVEMPFSRWRMENLTNFVGRLARTAERVRPGIRLSAAVWQKIGDGRDYYFQDGVEWVKQGHLDFVVPMIYTTSTESFEDRLQSYSRSAGAQNVVAGLGPYLEGFTDSLVAAELDITRRHGVKGFSIFNSDYALKYSDVIKGYAGGEP